MPRPGKPPWIDRHAQPLVERALRESRVVALLGPRQVGKTSLARRVADARGGTYRSLDDPLQLTAAREDPEAFLAVRPPLVVDEFQRAGDDFLRAIKLTVDRPGRPGQFLLTGSTQYLTVPRLSESLAGRVQIVELWPFSQGELRGRREVFLTRLFDEPAALRRLEPEPLTRHDLLEMLCSGGYPAVRAVKAGPRQRWFDGYIRTLLQRDVRDLTHVQHGAVLLDLLRLLAARTAQVLNVAEMGNELGLARSTLASYIPLLEAVYLLRRVPAWSRNLTSRVTKHPEVHLVDSGLAAHLLRATPAALADPTHRARGPLLESFVLGELWKQCSWSELGIAIHHYRDHNGPEVDLVLEASDGRVAGVEVKAGSAVGTADFRSLDLLRDRLGARFANGVVLASVPEPLSLGDRRTVLPISALWG